MPGIPVEELLAPPTETVGLTAELLNSPIPELRTEAARTAAAVIKWLGVRGHTAEAEVVRASLEAALHLEGDEEFKADIRRGLASVLDDVSEVQRAISRREIEVNHVTGETSVRRYLSVDGEVRDVFEDGYLFFLSRGGSAFITKAVYEGLVDEYHDHRDELRRQAEDRRANAFFERKTAESKAQDSGASASQERRRGPSSAMPYGVISLAALAASSEPL
jgi:hypothetical protein